MKKIQIVRPKLMNVSRHEFIQNGFVFIFCSEEVIQKRHQY